MFVSGSGIEQHKEERKEKKYYKLSNILSRERRHGIKDEMSDIFWRDVWAGRAFTPFFFMSATSTQCAGKEGTDDKSYQHLLAWDPFLTPCRI